MGIGCILGHSWPLATGSKRRHALVRPVPPMRMALGWSPSPGLAAPLGKGLAGCLINV